MSKRSGYFQLKQPLASKKPKLDIEIIPSQQYHPQPSTSKPNNAANGALKSSVENLWDDDDDDIIVLASQAVEASEDITFRQFSRSVQSSTQQTTELVTTAHVGPKGPGKVPDKLVAELFADGEDDLFSEKLDDNYRNFDNAINDYFNNNDDDFNLDEFRQQEQAPLVGGRQEPAPKLAKIEEEFKTPAPVMKPIPNKTPSFSFKEETRSTSRIGMIFKPKTSTVQKFPSKHSAVPQQSTVPSEVPKIEQEMKESNTQKQEHAKDIQVKYLTKHVEQLAKKLESVQKDCNDAVEKLQVKDGEVSMLRYELKMVKTTNEQLRLEKMREKETIQKDWIEKMKNLEKTISAQKVENEFKEIEIMNLKTKRLNATMRSSEVRDGVEAPKTSAQSESTTVTEASNPVHYESILSSMIPKLSLTEPVDQHEELHFDPHLFVNPTAISAQGRKLRKYSRITRNEFTIADQFVLLQTYLSQLLSDVATNGGRSSRSIQLSSDKFPLVAIATENGLGEIFQYCQRLGKQKEAEMRASGTNRSSERSVQGHPRSKMELTTPVNIFQQEKLFVGEQAIVIRRFLALVALYCRISNELVVEKLLKDGLVSRLANSIKQISDASFSVALHGMITGAAALLNGMSFRSARMKQYGEHGVHLIQLFRAIVLCQTDAPSSLAELSDFLRHLSQITDGSVNQLLDRLCFNPSTQQPDKHKSARKQYRLKSISFSQETCTLQMYAALLESSVRHYVPYEGWQLKPLLKNAENTIHFLRNVLLQPVAWVRSFCDRNDTAGCELCHIRTVTAFVTLLHRVLLCWNQRTVHEEEDVNRIQRIAQHAVLLLYDLFQTAYHKKLLRLGGHTVRYRLRIVYNWLKMYEKDFNFRPVHSTTIGMLDMRLLMSDPLRCSLETESEESEQEKKTATSEDARKAESKTVVDELYNDFFTTYHSKNATLLE
ncbi:ATR-interacting protein mus304 [Anopheles marshallii]|uniref:ATR-interacting protein mus304 n=1 Tax=Anopheles marshallii TaxID=1521116 RepID=UPI00237B74CF|nr:ATR-interacting protein mus304 [Anopheles marshallii]